MLKKTINFVDYEGVERTEDFYFNLTKTELTQMELSVPGGLLKTIEKIVMTKDNGKLIELFDTVLEKAYGIKSPDGRRFVKTEGLYAEFKQTLAYDELFVEFFTKEGAAVAFFNGILPQLPTTPPES